MTADTYPHEAQADLPGVAFTVMRQMILMQAKSGGLDVLEDDDGRLTVKTAHGLIGLRPGAEAETAGMVAATDPRWLFVMKNAVLRQMQHAMPEVAAAMRWSDTDGVGGLPPNFSFVRARDVAPLGPNFLRVTLEGEDLSAHQNDSIHFRLVQPPEGGEAEWPWVAPNGSIKWPDGDSAPHKPVYTARAVDYAANTMLVDIYIHDGGRTTEWAQGLLSGMRDRQVVGLLGPSGGGILEADRVLMATDETGFPAAARILENLPDGTTGDLYLEAENGADCDYSFEVPPGLSVTWFARAKGDTLARVTTEALAAHAGSKVWFAGERSQARDVREAAKAAGWEPKELRVSGFWTAPAG